MAAAGGFADSAPERTPALPALNTSQPPPPVSGHKKNAPEETGTLKLNTSILCIHFAVQLKLTQQCKAAILQLKIK